MPRAEGTPAGEGALAHSRLATAWPYALVLAVGAFVLLPRLGAYGFWDPWETRTVLSAREMLSSGAFVAPRYLGEVQPGSPILGLWGTMLGLALFGQGEFGARIGGVLAMLVALAGVYYAVSRVRGLRAGLLSALVLGTAAQGYLLAREATADVYMFTSLGLAVLFFAVALFAPDSRRDLHFVLAFVCWSVAVLAKGPLIAGVVFFVPLAIFATTRVDPAWLWSEELRPVTRRLLLRGGASLLALAGSLALLAVMGTSHRLRGVSTIILTRLLRLRESILSATAPIRLPEVALAALVVLGGWLALRGLRRAAPARRRRDAALAAAPGLLVLAAAVLGLALGSPRTRWPLLAGLAAAAAAGALARSLGRFLDEPAVRERTAAALRTVRRQTAVFAGIAAVVLGPWYLALLFTQGGRFFDSMLESNVGRLAGSIGSSGDATFYLSALIYGLFPWSCFLPLGLAWLFRWRERDPFAALGLETYLLLSTVVTFAAVSGAVTKLDPWLAPTLVPLSVVLGLTLDALVSGKHPGVSRLGWIVATMLFLPPMLDLLREDGVENLLAVFAVNPGVSDPLEPGRYFAALLVAFALVLCAAILLRSPLLLGGLVVLAALFAHQVATRVVPRVSAEKSLATLCAKWSAERGEEEALGLFGEELPGARLYCPGVRSLTGNELVEFLAPGRGARALVEKDHIEDVRTMIGRRYPGQEIRVEEGYHRDLVLVVSP